MAQKRVATDARRAQQRASYHRNRERILASRREMYVEKGEEIQKSRWIKLNPGRDYETRKRIIRRGIVADGDNALYQRKRMELIAGNERPDRCEICRREPEIGRALCFDHDHVTEVFRGWICRKCNWILGLVDDDPKILEALVLYLRRHGHE